MAGSRRRSFLSVSENALAANETTEMHNQYVAMVGRALLSKCCSAVFTMGLFCFATHALVLSVWTVGSPACVAQSHTGTDKLFKAQASILSNNFNCPHSIYFLISRSLENDFRMKFWMKWRIIHEDGIIWPRERWLIAVTPLSTRFCDQICTVTIHCLV